MTCPLKNIKLKERIAILEDLNDLENYLLRTQEIFCPGAKKENYHYCIYDLMDTINYDDFKILHLRFKKDFIIKKTNYLNYYEVYTTEF